MKKENKKVLLKDIIIPKGTIFGEAPTKTLRSGEGHFECIIGLSKDTSGSLVYYVDPDDEEIKEYFTDLK